VQVKDTGRGLSGAPIQAGGGVGLANIRERLAAIYVGQARFNIESNMPRGVVASIELPTEAPQFHGSTPALGGGVSSANPGPIQSGWRRAQNLTSRSHSLWARVVARTFIVLMVSLCIAFLAALAGLYSGWMPVQVGDLRLDGMEGMAVGSVGLLAAFGAVAFAILIVVAVLYGLGFFLAALVVFIPLVILLSLFPMLVPGMLVALGIYWWVRTRNKAQE
jgi:hypothetical protein